MGPNPSNQQPPETPANTIFSIYRIRAMNNPDLVAFFRLAEKYDADLYAGGGASWATARINKQNAAEEIRRRAKPKKPAAQPQPQTQFSY